MLFTGTITFAQNVGIGTISPLRAKIEVVSAETTTGIFGSSSTGISLQQNWPTIGFNQYMSNTGVSRFIGNGYAGNTFLDPVNGRWYFQMFGSGAANNSTGTGRAAFNISSNGITNFSQLEVSGTASFMGANLNWQDAVINNDLDIQNKSYIRLNNNHPGPTPFITNIAGATTFGQLLILEHSGGPDFFMNIFGNISMPSGFWASVGDTLTFVWNGTTWKLVSKIDF